jgi:Spy/CpxP family protein refolding chaperone
VQVGDLEQRRLQRQEWQKEITNRVEEIKSLLTPEQVEKFKSIQVPNIVAPPSLR